MIETVITSSILILVVLILRTAFKGRISSKARYALWLIVVIRLALPFSLVQSSVSVMNFVGNGLIFTVTEQSGENAAPENNSGIIQPDTSVSDNSAPPENIQAVSPTGLPSPPEAPQPPKCPADPVKWAKTVWLCVMSAMLLWFAAVNVIFYSGLRRKRKIIEYNCPLKLYIVNGLKSPCIFGFIRPSIYVSEEVAQDKQTLDFIAAHEYCHYLRGDMLWTVLRYVMTAVYWFNPLVWLAAFVSKQDCEAACDEAAIKRIGEENRIEYGKALISMIPRKRRELFGVASTSMSSAGKALKERISLIAEKPKNAVFAVIGTVLVMSAAVGCTFTSAPNDGNEQTKDPASVTDPEETTPEENTSYAEDDHSQLKYRAGDVIYSFAKAALYGNDFKNYRVDFVMKSDDYSFGLPENENAVSGSYALRIYDETGNMTDEIGIVTAAARESGVTIDTSDEQLEQLFKFSYGADNRLIFSCPVSDGEKNKYLTSFYGIDESGGLFQYGIDMNEFPRDIHSGGNELLLEDFTNGAMMYFENPAESSWLNCCINYSSSGNTDCITVISFDESSRTVKNLYSASGERNGEALAAAEKAMLVQYGILSFTGDIPLENSVCLEESFNEEGYGYYQVDTDIASSEDELIEYILDSYIDLPIGYSSEEELRTRLFEEQTPGYGEDERIMPYFKMIDGKLCYLNEYRGVSLRWTNQSVTEKNGEDSYDVFFVSFGADYYTLHGYTVKKCPDGKWRAKYEIEIK